MYIGRCHIKKVKRYDKLTSQSCIQRLNLKDAKLDSLLGIYSR